jgi:hypothetical protein
MRLRLFVCCASSSLVHAWHMSLLLLLQAAHHVAYYNGCVLQWQHNPCLSMICPLHCRFCVDPLQFAGKYCLQQWLCPAVAAQVLREHAMPCHAMPCPCTVLCLLTRCRLPANIACDNGCVLQWHYYSMQSCVLQGCNPATCGDYARGRNVVYGSTPGWCGIASGQPEFFTNCAGALHCRLSFLCIPWCKGSLLHHECSLLVGDAAVVLADMSACHLHLPLSDLYCQLKIVGQA